MAHFLAPLFDAGAGAMAVVVDGRSADPVASVIETAFDGPTRKRGLLGRASLAKNAVMIIAPCNAIHTFKMQFPIDAIFADRTGRILKISHRLPPTRVSASPRAFAVLEMTAGEAERHGLQTGDRLAIATRQDLRT